APITRALNLAPDEPADSLIIGDAPSAGDSSVVAYRATGPDGGQARLYVRRFDATGWLEPAVSFAPVLLGSRPIAAYPNAGTNDVEVLYAPLARDTSLYTAT